MTELTAIDFSKFRSNWYRPSPSELSDYSLALDMATEVRQQTLREDRLAFDDAIESLYENLLSLDSFNGLLHRLVVEESYLDVALELRSFLRRHLEVCAERTARLTLTDPKRLERE